MGSYSLKVLLVFMIIGAMIEENEGCWVGRCSDYGSLFRYGRSVSNNVENVGEHGKFDKRNVFSRFGHWLGNGVFTIQYQNQFFSER